MGNEAGVKSVEIVKGKELRGIRLSEATWKRVLPSEAYDPNRQFDAVLYQGSSNHAEYLIDPLTNRILAKNIELSDYFLPSNT